MMDFLINSAWAQAAPEAPDFLASIFPLLLIFGVFYFLLIRPQMKRAKEHRALVSELAVGDEVITNGGLLGKIRNVADTFLDVELAEGCIVKLQKHAVSTVLPKGTIKGTVKAATKSTKSKSAKTDDDN